MVPNFEYINAIPWIIPLCYLTVRGDKELTWKTLCFAGPLACIGSPVLVQCCRFKENSSQILVEFLADIPEGLTFPISPKISVNMSTLCFVMLDIVSSILYFSRILG